MRVLSFSASMMLRAETVSKRRHPVPAKLIQYCQTLQVQGVIYRANNIFPVREYKNYCFSKKY